MDMSRPPDVLVGGVTRGGGRLVTFAIYGKGKLESCGVQNGDIRSEKHKKDGTRPSFSLWLLLLSGVLRLVVV